MEMSAGFKTTEFWGKVVIQGVLVLNKVFGLGIQIDDATAMTIAGGLEAIYSLSRSNAKAAGGVNAAAAASATSGGAA